MSSKRSITAIVAVLACVALASSVGFVYLLVSPIHITQTIIVSNYVTELKTQFQNQYVTEFATQSESHASQPYTYTTSQTGFSGSGYINGNPAQASCLYLWSSSSPIAALFGLGHTGYLQGYFLVTGYDLGYMAACGGPEVQVQAVQVTGLQPTSP